MAVMPPNQASADSPGGETIEALFAALESPLLLYAQRLAGDFAVAEDMVQDAFMKLHAQFSEVREPRRWLYRTIHNQCLNHRRDGAKLVALSSPADDHAAPQTDLPDCDPLPDELIARWENIGLVRLSLDTLDERSRELVRLKFDEGLSYREIATRTGLKIGNVGYLLHHALKGIADELARNGVAP